MNFKKMAKRFFTLSQNHDGFTLVELIVVIAIMAILAGVAVPAYTGYINKANKASDLQLLGAINTAFGAAALENGENVKTLSATPVISLNADKTVAGVNMFSESFARYFKGNENSAFKVIEVLYFDARDGVFAELPGEYAGLVGSFSAEDITNVVNSTYYTSEGLGVNVLLGQVDYLSGIAGALIGDPGTSFFNLVLGPEGDGNTAYMNNLATSMGYTMPDDQGEFMGKLAELAGGDESKLPQVLGNSVVLSVANGAKDMSTEEMTALLTSGAGLKDAVQGNLNNVATAEKGLAQAAMAYGIFTSYAHYTGDEDLIKQAEKVESVTDLYNILGEMQGEQFESYMNGQGKTDLAGYQSAMNMINDSAKDETARDNVLMNGFDDPALSALVNQALAGSKSTTEE